MFRKLWRRFRESSERHEQEKDEAAIERALLEREQKPRDGWSEADQTPPPVGGWDSSVSGL